MIDNAALRVVLSGVFGVATAYYIARVVTATAVAERVSGGWHALTGVAMVAMLWSWGLPGLPVLGIVVFGGAVVWFVLQALPGAFGCQEIQRSGWYHAVMAASMIWMWTSIADTDPAGMNHAGRMPGMTDVPERMKYLSLAGGGFYLIATAWFAFVLFRALRQTSPIRVARSADVPEFGANMLMAAGMAAWFLVAA